MEVGKFGCKFLLVGIVCKSAFEVACEVAKWAGPGLVLGKGGGGGGTKTCLEILMGSVGWEKCL